MVKLKIDENVTVKELRRKFKDAIGLSLRVYVGNNAGKGAVKAEETDKLGALADEKEIPSGSEFIINPGMTAGDFEKYFQSAYDIAIQVADASNKKLMANDSLLLAPDNMSQQSVY